MNSIKTLIKRRRLQILIHSYIYYELNTNVISDDVWQQWANELRALQHEYPQHCKIGCYDKIFKDWNGNTGMHLPKDTYIINKSLYILHLHNKLHSQDK